MDRYKVDYTKTQQTTRWGEIESTDMTIPPRIVGSFEYQRALDSFSKLLLISTPDELEVYNKIMGERPEFTFYHGPQAAFRQSTSDIKIKQFRRDEFDDEFLKKGLAWMMALARVELGATLSMYGNSKEPFQDISTSPFDRAAYIQILVGDVETHLEGFQRDTILKQVAKPSRKVDAWTMAYLRRINLLRDMLSALKTVASPREEAIVSKFDRRLRKIEQTMISSVMNQIAPMTQTNESQYSRMSRTTRTRAMGNKRSSIRECLDSVRSDNAGSGDYATPLTGK